MIRKTNLVPSAVSGTRGRSRSPSRVMVNSFGFVVLSQSQGRRPSWTFRGLLNVHSRYGLSARRVAKRPVYLQGSDAFVSSTAAPIATGWSDPVAGQDFHLLKTNT